MKSDLQLVYEDIIKLIHNMSFSICKTSFITDENFLIRTNEAINTKPYYTFSGVMISGYVSVEEVSNRIYDIKKLDALRKKDDENQVNISL